MLQGPEADELTLYLKEISMTVVIIQGWGEGGGGGVRQNKWLCMFQNCLKVLMNHQSPPAINVFQIL